MSVIFGIKENQQIIIAGDKRISTADGARIGDHWQKVIPVNDQLAFASAGNGAIEKAIVMDVMKADNVPNMVIEDLCELISAFCQRCEEAHAHSIKQLPFYGIIAGKSREGNGKLVSCGLFKGKFEWKEVPMALYPPSADVHDLCVNSFVRNYKLHHDSFVERTIHEISEISDLVSATGSKWIYDLITQKGYYIDFE